MKSLKKTIVLTLFLILGNSILLFSQDTKVDFSAKWKKHTDKAVIVVSISKGNEPYIFYVYDGSPFNNGILLSKTENITTKTFEVEIEKKMKVFVCVFKDDRDYSCKWLEITKK